MELDITTLPITPIKPNPLTKSFERLMSNELSS